MAMTDKCPSCNVPWGNHPGIALTCASLQTQKLLNAELRKVDAPRFTLELLVRLGYEMECLSTSRCAELLGESVVTFRERGWVQSRIVDALSDAETSTTDRELAHRLSQILKDFE